MKRYLCIHGHFYQPPRENPWLDELEIQDSAKPFHDWNEKILTECYAPNAAARIIDEQKRILKISNNYSQISFNFGPTLLAWMEKHAQKVYQAILEADQYSTSVYNGHGNAIAQVYNHIIMPLASRRDKQIQIRWGIKDFLTRFKRFPEGMWLAETAVDLETLELLAEAGIKFTILAPNQASRIKKIGVQEWMDVKGGKIDPTLPYRCFLRNGNCIDIFFYDGPISNSIAFEKILNSSDVFIDRLISGFWNERIWDQILSVATDGESYGHHHKFGEMALACALSHIRNYNIELINYGYYLEKYPPMFQVEIIENTAWSCSHGVERWRGDCGCNTGGHPDWNQAWRKPIREGLNYLKNKFDFIFETEAIKYLNDPWDAFLDYIDIVLDRSSQMREAFLNKHQIETLESSKETKVLKLMEMQRFAQLMFTSCGWFFDDISGIETVQILKYAARSIQLAGFFTNEDIEGPFVEIISQAKSNIPEKGSAKTIYQEEVLPQRINIKNVLRHYAISSLYENYAPDHEIYCFNIKTEDFRKNFKKGKGLLMGKTKITNLITLETLEAQFAVLQINAPNYMIYIKESPFSNNFSKIVKHQFWRFDCGKIDLLKKNLGKDFQPQSLTLKELFLEERRKIAKLMSKYIFKDFEQTYKRIYEEYKPIMNDLFEMDIPVPQGFQLAAKYFLTGKLKSAMSDFVKSRKNWKSIIEIIEQSKKLQIYLDKDLITKEIKRHIELLFEQMAENPLENDLLLIINSLLDIINGLELEMEIWCIQNLFYDFFYNKLPKYPTGQEEDRLRDYKALGERLNFFIE